MYIYRNLSGKLLKLPPNSIIILIEHYIRGPNKCSKGEGRVMETLQVVRLDSTCRIHIHRQISRLIGEFTKVTGKIG